MFAMFMLYSILTYGAFFRGFPFRIKGFSFCIQDFICIFAAISETRPTLIIEKK